MGDKAAQTRVKILDKAFNLAASSSLNELTIGSLAVATGMSKSGLFAHFQSKEKLQMSVLTHAIEKFRAKVVTPTLGIADPLTRLKAACENWLEWYLDYADNCIFISATFELDDKPGPVQDALKEGLSMWVGYLEKTVKQVIEADQFDAKLDASQFVFELYGCYLSSQMFVWLGSETPKRQRFRDAFESLIDKAMA